MKKRFDLEHMVCRAGAWALWPLSTMDCFDEAVQRIGCDAGETSSSMRKRLWVFLILGLLFGGAFMVAGVLAALFVDIGSPRAPLAVAFAVALGAVYLVLGCVLYLETRAPRSSHFRALF